MGNTYAYNMNEVLSNGHGGANLLHLYAQATTASELRKGLEWYGDAYIAVLSLRMEWDNNMPVVKDDKVNSFADNIRNDTTSNKVTVDSHAIQAWLDKGYPLTRADYIKAAAIADKIEDAGLAKEIRIQAHSI